MKAKKTMIFILILLLIGGFTFIALNGIEIGNVKIKKAKDSVDLGLDLAGGVYVVLEADTDAKGEELHQLMEQTKTIITKRVDGLGVAEPNIVIEGDKRIRIELAGIDNPQEAIDLIGKTAQLQFIDSKGEVVVSGKNVVGSQVQYHNNEMGKQEVVVSLEFDKEGKELFAKKTGELINNEKIEDRVIFIVLDDQVISYPSLRHISEGGEAITDGKAVITGNFTLETASNLSNLINAGALPAEMIEQTTSVIGPTLGLEAYEKSIKAGGIALLIIFAFMIVVYKVPGFISSLSLIIYTLIVIYTMAALGVKLTLPGIAGLILSVGMAVDANVLIFERIREELRVGKTIRTSIDAGFKRALTSVMDSNITTLIAGLVLYYFGVGPIKGFGVTLIIGIVASIITSVFITKFLLKLFVDMTNAKNEKLYGA